MSKNLQIVPLTKSMLREGIEKNRYWKDTLSPLPKSKATWLVSNARIEEGDYCGVLAFENEKMISFIFMFPDFLNTNEKECKKVYWMISWWVDKAYKDTVLGTYVFNESLNLADNQIVIKSYAENVTAFYEKQPFKVIASRLRYTMFFSLDASMLIGRFKFLKSFKFILNKIDAFSGYIIRSINKNKSRSSTKELSYDYINHLDDDTWAFVAPLCDNDLIAKSKEYINWQLDNNQYVQTPVADKQTYKALQTGISNNIHIHTLKILLGTKIIGFLSYIINFNEFNIKYFLVEDDKLYNLCVDALMDHFIKSKSTFIFTDDTKLFESINKRYSVIFTHKVMKKGLAHKNTEVDLEKVSLTNRDGHFY